MTSYPARINNVYRSIELLMTKQLEIPDEIHLFLSKEEFNNIPSILQNTIDKYDVKLHWTIKNTYVHKRHEIFRYTNDEDYVFFIDDDVEYDKTLIKNVMTIHNKFENSIICYNPYHKHKYDGIRILYGKCYNYNNPSINDIRWCGQSMIPSKLYPKYILTDEYVKIRDKTSPISDECWFQPWIVNNNIPIYNMTYNWGKDISCNIKKEDGLVKYSHEIVNGYERRDIWLNNVLKSFPNIMNKYIELFNYGK